MNTSATGGFLVPGTSIVPLQGRALNRFLQQWIVGITGMPNTMVRPSWQSEPPVIPQAGALWIALAVRDTVSDWMPFQGYVPGIEDYVQVRNEAFDLFCSVYDLGVDGQADEMAALIRDSAMIAQNSEYLSTENFKVIGTSQLITAPVLIKERWQYRVDIAVSLARQIYRTYPVLDLLSATATIQAAEAGPVIITDEIVVTE